MTREEIEYALTIAVEEATGNVQLLERVIMRTLSLMNRLGLPENVKYAVIWVQRLTSSIRMLRISLMLLETASGPLGWASALLHLGSFALESSNMIYDAGRGT